MNLDELKNKKIAILGLGIEGIALAEFLCEKVKEITILDQTSEEKILNRLTGKELVKAKRILSCNKNKKQFGLKCFDDLSKFDIIFRSPGISYLNPKIQEALKNNIEVTSQIKLFFGLCPAKIIGVTGTKGKGTTASLISEILKENSKLETRNSKQIQNSNDEISKQNSDFSREVYLAGNIGYPAITLIDKVKEDDIVILELSSFQLMDLEVSPHISVFTNLYEDHLDYHSDIEEYKKAKFNILKYQSEKDFAVLNFDATFSNEYINQLKSKVLYFSKTQEKDVVVRKNNENYEVILDPKNRNIKICDEKNIKLFGLHNLENIAAASIVTDILNVEYKKIQEVVKNFKGLPHRLEFIGEIDGVKFINDSFATNPEPTQAAIDSFSENKILILGGSSKRADFSQLANKISNTAVESVILIGDETKKINEALIKEKYSGKIIEGADNMQEIVKQAKELSHEGDIILLSPGCASFGLFKNYKDRGEQFKNNVFKLKSEVQNPKSETNYK